jgi:hypothetical protein
LDWKGKFNNSIKFQFNRELCGTVNRYNNSIFERNDSTFLKLHTTHPWTIDSNEDVNATSEKTYFVGKNLDLFFLNGTKTFHFTGNDFYQKELESNVYLEKLKGEKINILRIEKFDSLIKTTYLLERIKLKKIESNKNQIINHSPFIFEKANKYGYYPLQIITKYKSLTTFNWNFAAFVLPNGQKGWLDRNGKEYFY